MKITEILIEIIDYIQACREAGETDLRPILSFVESLIIEYSNKEKTKEEVRLKDLDNDTQRKNKGE